MAYEIKISKAGNTKFLILVESEADVAPDTVDALDAGCRAANLGNGRFYRSAIAHSGDEILLFGVDRVTVERIAP
jgi:hypothetical protein